MSSTNLNTSPYKLTVIVVSVVVSLHILTAVALVMVAPPVAKIEIAETTPPMEIQLLTPVVENEKIEEIEIKTENVPVEAVLENQPLPKPKNKPQTAASNPSQVTKVPKPSARKEEPPKVNTQTTTDKGLKKPILSQKLSQPVINEVTNDVEKRKQRLAAQAHEKAMLQAQADRETEQARLQAEQAAQAAQAKRDVASAAAKAQVVKEAAERAAQAKAAAKEAAAKAEQAAAAQTASNEPVGYGTIGKSSWQKEPDFRFIKSQTDRFNSTQTEVSVSVSMSVDARGQLHNIKIKKSSGDNQFDRDFVKALSKAKLHPATRNDKAIASTATFPFRMIL